MQPKQIQKQPREHKVPVTIKSSITLLLKIEQHMRSVKASMGEGKNYKTEPDMEAQEMYEVSRGQQETALTVGRVYAPLTTHFTFSLFPVKV